MVRKQRYRDWDRGINCFDFQTSKLKPLSDEEVSAPKKKKTKTADDDEDDDEDDENAEDADEDGNIKGLIASSDGEVADSDDDGSHRNVLQSKISHMISGPMIKTAL